MSKDKICIIGAGPSGISALLSFYKKEQNITCYEKQGDWGGLWNYTWQTGINKYGDNVHGSMYRHLWSNGPKECLEFSNYSFDEHFKKPIPSFPPREVLHDYITGRVKDTSIKDSIKFNHTVKHCQYYKEASLFKVTVYDNINNREITEFYNWVVCASGHFSVPNIPEWDGMDTFTGRILHSHDFRNAEEMKDKDILIIGTSYSAEDIASQCYKYGVKSVTLSWRTAPMKFKWPDNFSTVPLLERINHDTCYFKDGTSKKIDDIILCTGYQHSFPFLSDELDLKTTNKLYPNMLYDGVVHQNNPKLFFIGMQDQWFTFNMFDAQAWYIRDVILGKIELPSKQDMMHSIASWQYEECILGIEDEDKIRFQADYLKYMLGMTDLNNFDIESVVFCFFDWEHNKEEDIMTFRDKPHKSVITNTMGTVHHTPWLREYNDTIENFI